jgi:hypothetical protein
MHEPVNDEKQVLMERVKTTSIVYILLLIDVNWFRMEVDLNAYMSQLWRDRS